MPRRVVLGLLCGVALVACASPQRHSPDPAPAVGVQAPQPSEEAAPNVAAAQQPAPSEAKPGPSRDPDAVGPDQDDGVVAALSTLTPSEPVTTGSLSKDEIQTEVRRNLSRIRLCYERELMKSPTLAGRLETSFTIGVDGSVIDATATGFAEPNVAQCVVGALRAMQFPKPKGGGIVIVRYPFAFAPSP